MKRKRRVEITRYSRRITVMHNDDAIDFAATEETTADVLLKLSDIAPFTLQEVDDGEAASEAPAGIPLRQRFLRFFTRLKR